MASEKEEVVTAPVPPRLACKNCGRELRANTTDRPGILHDNDLMRCIPWESGQPYGLVAELPE